MAEKSNNNLNTEEEISILSNPPSNNPSQHSLSLNPTIANANDDAGDRNSATALPNSRSRETDHNCNIPTATESVTVSKAVSGDLTKLSVGQLVAQLKMARTRIRELEVEKAKILGCPITTSLEPTTNKTSCDKDKILQKKSTPSFFKDLYLDDFLRKVREDMSNEELNSQSQTIFDGGTWEKCSESEDESHDIREKSSQNDDFPLIPSPVLNTPPYEYIFLTRENEAKFRIFLNQKLNKVFQEELHKLQNQDESDLEEESSLEDKQGNCEADGTKADKTNHTRLSNCHSMGLIETKSNVIHCFDPSDVDLELKKIFTDKPPTTHKIVRRKSRLDRGSSVPAVDSYYGTSDLSKVGHASYFIPLLTESERKAIGWKPDYHFGHWKYTTMNIPNIRMNPISLHPHPHLDDSLTSHKHSHHRHHFHHQDHLLSQNPLHQKEINFSDPFLFDSDDSTKHTTHHSKTSCPNPIHQIKSDSMSFITLSGDSGDPSSHSCHLIPDRCTLKKILKWILPSCISSKKSEKLSFNPGHSRSEVGENDNHEIQTIVAAPDKLVFATSHTHISFAALKSGEIANNDTPSNDNMQDVPEPNHKHRTCTTDSHNKGEKSNSHHHNHHLRRDEHHDHKSHSHHHGIFHWINLLHGARKSDDSMSVVGGDVLVSSQGSVIVPVDQRREDRMSTESGLQQTVREKAIRPFDYDSFTDTETEDETKPGGEKKVVKRRKGLKPSRAYDKLLTLKDLGYQTDHGESVGEESDSAAEETGENAKTKMPASPQGYLKRTGRLICHKQKKKTQNNGAGRKSKQVLAKKNQKKKHISLNIENDADDDLSSGSGSNFSPPNVASQQISAATHFDDEDTLPNFIPSLMRDMIHTNSIESRFLDPKDIVQPRFQDKLPFVYDVGESFLDTGNLFNQDDYVLEWMDNNFEEFEEGLGLLKSCLGTIIHSDDSFVNTSEIVICDKKNEIIPGKVEGQHRIVTLNELDSKDDADNMNQPEHIRT